MCCKKDSTLFLCHLFLKAGGAEGDRQAPCNEVYRAKRKRRLAGAGRVFQLAEVLGHPFLCQRVLHPHTLRQGEETNVPAVRVPVQGAGALAKDVLVAAAHGLGLGRAAEEALLVPGAKASSMQTVFTARR
jgi:hypothetical protein